MQCLIITNVSTSILLLFICFQFNRTQLGRSAGEFEIGLYENDAIDRCARPGDESSFCNTIFRNRNGECVSRENLGDHMINNVVYLLSFRPPNYSTRFVGLSSEEVSCRAKEVNTFYSPTSTPVFAKFLSGKSKGHRLRCNKHGNESKSSKQRRIARGRRKRTKRPLTVLSSETYGAARMTSLSITESTTDLAVQRLRHRNGRDGVLRRPLSRTSQRQTPFCNVAYLKSSLTCSGTVITPYHVLTAAHCVHDGAQFDANVNRMRVTVRSRDGFESRRVQSVHVPRSWIYRSGGHETSTRRSDSARAIHDYAVIVLDHALPTFPGCPRNGTINFGNNATLVYHNLQASVRGKRVRVSFASFPATEKRKMWQTSCTTLDQSAAAIRGGLVATGCPSLKGSSGSAVFMQVSSLTATSSTYSPVGTFIGVISHKVRVTDTISYMVVTVMNQSKRQVVSDMINEERNYFPDVMQDRHGSFLSYFVRQTHGTRT